MQCPSCGMALTPGTTTCPGCGAYLSYNTYNTVPVNVHPNAPAPQPYPYGQEMGRNNPDYPHYPHHPNYPNGSSNPNDPTVQASYGTPGSPSGPNMPPYAGGGNGQPPYPYAPYPSPYQQGNNPYRYNAPNVPQMPPAPALPPFPVPPKPATQNGMSGSTKVLLGIMAVIMILGGLGLILYTAVLHPAQLRADATATVQTQQTNTAIANAHATGTVQAYTNATATAQAQATVQAQATATALQNFYNQSTSGTPALNSPLSYQDSANWEVYNTVDGGGCGFTGGSFHSSVPSKGYYVACFARTTNFSNFAFQVQMTILKGDEGGILFRANPTSYQYYFLIISRSGAYSLYLSKDKQHNLSIAGDNSAAIKTAVGQANLVTAIAKGGTIYLYINKQFVGSVNDSTFGAGQIGVLSSDNTNSTDVAFNNAQVWKL